MRSAMLAASQYLEGGPLMWMMPLHLHVYQKSDYDDMRYSITLSIHNNCIFTMENFIFAIGPTVLFERLSLWVATYLVWICLHLLINLTS